MSSKSSISNNLVYGNNTDITRSPVFHRAVMRAAQFKCIEALKAGKIRLVQDPSVGMPNRYTPRMDLVDDKTSNKLTAIFELPGVKTSDISLQIRDGNLIVTGERRIPQMVRSALAAQRPPSFPSNPVTAADNLAAGEMDSDSPNSPSLNVAVHELRFGTFYRALPVPDGIKESDVTAALQDGMLTVTWPNFGRVNQGMALPVTLSTSANAAQ